MSEHKTQKEAILFYLENVGDLTTFDAFYRLGITKLTTRISELRRDGYDIVGETVKSGKAKYNRYHLNK